MSLKKKKFIQILLYEIRRYTVLWICAFVLLIFILTGIFAYFIIPDKSRNANTQILAYSLLPKKSNVNIAIIPAQPPSGNLWTGLNYSHTVLPIDSFIQKKDTYIIYHANKVDTIRNAVMQKKYYKWGSDKYGRDIYSRILLSTRTSLSIGFFSTLIAILVGILLGLYSGYYGGWIEKFLLWFTNIFWAIPSLLVIVGISFAIGKGFTTIFIALGCTLWVSVARAVRGQVLVIKQLEYIQASKAMAFPSARILYFHILPNLWSIIIVYSTETFANAILMEAGLSFLGLGIQPPVPSWGSMLKDGVYYFTSSEYAHLAWYPGIAIMLVVLCFNLLANALRDRFDVKFKHG
jgi:peptide/nickel transport system permease protein